MLTLDPKNPRLIIVKDYVSRADAKATDEDLDEKYRKPDQEKCVQRAERERRWALIEPLVSSPEEHILLFDPSMRCDLIARRASEITDTRRTFKRLKTEIRDCLNQYWAGGSVKGALTPFFGACGARGKEKIQRRKLGRRNTKTRRGAVGVAGYVLTAHDKDIIRFAWRNYYTHGKTKARAFREMGRQFYSTTTTDDSGHANSDLLPATERPTPAQFHRWGSGQSLDQMALVKQLSKTNAARTYRALQGKATDGIVAVGQRASVDSSPPDIEFVSVIQRLDRIGGAHRILVVESLYRYIPGFYLGLHAPSSQTVNLAFLHAATPKQYWLDFLGLKDQSPDAWLQIAFTSVVSDNTDARAEQVFISLDSIGAGSFFIPVARSDLNSAAEVSHHQLHRMADHNMHGTTHGRRRERMEARADDLARHTIIEAIRETARAVHTHNTMPLDINPTLEMRRELLDKGLQINRLNLTRLRIQQGKVARGLLDIDEYRTHLMPTTRGTFTARGVKLLRPDTGDKRCFVEPVRYTSTHPLMVERFIRAKTERSKHRIDFYDADFRHDPYNPTEIFYREPHTGDLIRLEARTDDRELLQTCSYYDIIMKMDDDLEYRRDAAEGRDQALSRMEAAQEETKDIAAAEYDAQLKAEPKPRSKASLRANKAENREREDALYQYGMPVPPAGEPLNVPVSKNASQEAESPSTGESTASPIQISPRSAEKQTSGLSIFGKLVQSHLDKEVHNG